MLPIYTHNVEVIATNSAGEAVVNLTINKPLQGAFSGTITSSNGFFSSPFNLEFSSDNTLLFEEEESTVNIIDGKGVWTNEDSNVINVDYTYEDGTKKSLSGTITVSETKEVYSGYWYSAHGSIEANKKNVFEVTKYQN